MTVKIKFTPGAQRKIRYLPKVADFLTNLGEQVAQTANSTLDYNGTSDLQPGYSVSSRPGRRVGPRGFGRWRVTVAAVTPHAKRHNAVHNTLKKAIGV